MSDSTNSKSKDKKDCQIFGIIPELKGRLSKFTKGIHYWSQRNLIDLENADDISRVSLILKILDVTPGYDFFDEEFNGYSPERVCEIIGMSPNIKNKDIKFPFNYEIIPINSFNEAKEVAWNESWCIVISEESFYEYTKGGNRFYFLANKNWRKVPCIPGMNFPYDEYGYSLIAVEMSPENKIVSVTSRWNNCSNNPNYFLSPDELKEILKEKFEELFI